MAIALGLAMRLRGVGVLLAVLALCLLPVSTSKSATLQMAHGSPQVIGDGSATCEFVSSDGCFSLPLDFTVFITEIGSAGEPVNRNFEFTYVGDGRATFHSTILLPVGFSGTITFGQVDGPGLSLIDTISLGSGPTTLQFLAEVLYGIKVEGSFGPQGGVYNIGLTAVPIPPALLLFGSALVGLGYLARRRGRSIGPSLPS